VPERKVETKEGTEVQRKRSKGSFLNKNVLREKTGMDKYKRRLDWTSTREDWTARYFKKEGRGI
jgi:hypothetical protein